MSLLDEFKCEYVIMDKITLPDGEGGVISSYQEGASLMLALRFDTSMEARRAMKEGVTSVYTFFAPKKCGLSYHDILKRKSDGEIFRLTSNADDSTSPGSASFDLTTFTAEKWKLQ